MPLPARPLRIAVACGVMAAFIAIPDTNAQPNTDCPNYPITGFCAPGDVASEPTQAVLPDVPAEDGGAVIGGGPGGDPAAQQRIAQQLPYFNDPNVVQGDGSSALNFIRVASKFNSTTRTVFTLLDTVAGCAYDYGAWAGRFYRQTTGLWGGAVLVVSGNAINSAGSIALQCLRDKLAGSVSGGGPGGGGPCFNSYSYQAAPGGVPDTYYVATAGYPDAFCDALAGFYSGATSWP